MKIIVLINLLNNVSPEFENECDIISHSKYCTDVDFQEILQEANCDICIVNLTCLNLKTRFDQLIRKNVYFYYGTD